MRRTSMVGLLAAALLAAGAAPALAQRTLTLGEGMGPGTPEAAALGFFKHEVAERSDGRLTIDVRLRDLPGPLQPPLARLAAGTLDLYSGPLEAFQPLLPRELGVVSLPYIFRDDAHLRRYLKSAVFAGAEQKLVERGIRFISTEFNGVRPYRLIMATRPTTRLEDLQNLKVRLDPNDVTVRSWRNLGAVPVEVGWNETYLALRQGAAEAVTVPAGLVRASNFVHVARYVAVTYEYPQAWPMAVSELAWRKLSPEERGILVDAANAAGLVYTRLAREAAERDIAAATAQDHAVFTRLDVAPLRRRMQPFYRDLIAQGILPREVYDAVESLAP